MFLALIEDILLNFFKEEVHLLHNELSILSFDGALLVASVRDFLDDRTADAKT